MTLSSKFNLLGHIAPVNVVDFDDRHILTASGDRIIKVRCNLVLYPNDC